MSLYPPGIFKPSFYMTSHQSTTESQSFIFKAPSFHSVTMILCSLGFSFNSDHHLVTSWTHTTNSAFKTEIPQDSICLVTLYSLLRQAHWNSWFQLLCVRDIYCLCLSSISFSFFWQNLFFPFSNFLSPTDKYHGNGQVIPKRPIIKKLIWVMERQGTDTIGSKHAADGNHLCCSMKNVHRILTPTRVKRWAKIVERKK